MSDKFEVKDNKEKKRFELDRGGNISFVDYILTNQEMIYLTHTEVPKELEGKGIASDLLMGVLQILSERELSIVPICPFVKSYLSRNPEWKRLLHENHRF
jgi:predicted GNAT family acetyltransferase